MRKRKILIAVGVFATGSILFGLSQGGIKPLFKPFLPSLLATRFFKSETKINPSKIDVPIDISLLSIMQKGKPVMNTLFENTF